MYIIILSIVGVLIIAAVIFVNLPRFGRTPSGERLKRIEQSPNYNHGEFRNQTPTPQLTSDKGRAQVMLDFFFKKSEHNRPEGIIPTVKSDLKNLSTDKDAVVWLGHSSYFLIVGGKRFLVDPVFYDAAPVWFINRPFRGTDLYKAEDMPPIDYLVITHDHWDHLDHTLVKKLRGSIGKVICPLGVGEHFERWGYAADRLVELDWHEQAELDPTHTIYCIPTRHFSGRGTKANQTLWASFVLKTPSRTIYIGGDGGYDDRFVRLAEQFPQIDLALIENGQYNADWRYIHMLPADFAQAVKDLGARNVIGGHNSKYALARHSWREPLDNIASIETVITPTIGSVVYIQDTMASAGRWWDGVVTKPD